MNSSVARETDDQAQYEDEKRIGKEERLSVDDEHNELARLQADADIPLDQLVKIYSKSPATIHDDLSSDEESFSSSEVDEDDDEEEEEEDDEDGNGRRHHLFHVNGELLPDNDDEEEDSLYEPEIVKVIHVGEEHQAYVESHSMNGYCNEREVSVDELLWSSFSVNEADQRYIDEYLKTIHIEYPFSDDEISLQTLFNCQFNIKLALAKLREMPNKTIYSYSAWPRAEVQQFEEGLREYGKNFFKISTFKCPNRSVREVVHFYYQWKKSERYRLFIQEQQRFNSLSSVSDIIGKLIDKREQQLCTAAGVADSTKNSCFKFHAPLSSRSSISYVTVHQQETTKKRSFDQMDNDGEISSSSAKKISINTKTSSAETTAAIVQA